MAITFHMSANLAPINPEVRQLAELKARLFPSDVVRSFPGLSAVDLKHVCLEQREDHRVKGVNIRAAQTLLLQAKREINHWYRQTYGKPFNSFELGEERSAVVRKYHEHWNFKKACQTLGLSSDQASQIALPWWTEIACSEVALDSSACATLAPRHSYETLMMRLGATFPIRNVSVFGIIRSAPDADSPTGHLMFGLRGGLSYPGTHHVNAGALAMTGRLRSGHALIYDHFRAELGAEFGLRNSHIESATFLGRIFDGAIENGACYTFEVTTRATKGDLYNLWKLNKNRDKGEHTKPVFLPADSENVKKFLADRYRGLVGNKKDRSEHEAYILHPGAIALATAADVPLDYLKDLVQLGTW